MKKIIVVSIAVLFCFIAASANAAGDTQLVIKEGNVITVYKITDLGIDPYGEPNCRVDKVQLTKPSLWDLRCAGAPEKSWKMCSWENSGIFFSGSDEATREIKELQNQLYILQDELSATSKQSSTFLFLFFCFLVLFIISAGLYINLRRKFQSAKS